MQTYKTNVIEKNEDSRSRRGELRFINGSDTGFGVVIRKYHRDNVAKAKA
jgi:hypothetical protein